MIIVTGANGFIGSAIIWELNQNGREDIIAVDSVPIGERPELLAKRDFHAFLERDELWDYLKNPDQIDWVIHMGACSDTRESNLDFLKENNTLYTQRLWEWCASQQKPFIYASSAAIYGDGAQGFNDSMDPAIFMALNPYGDSKLVFDRWALKAKKTPPAWFGLRFFNVYGPGEYHKGYMRSVVQKAMEQIRDTGRLELFKSYHPDYRDGEQRRDFVYVKDITRWISELMKTPAKTSGIYNMGFGVARTWLDLATAVFQNMDKPVKIDWIEMPEDMRPRYQYFTEAKMERFLSLGVSQPAWPIEKGVADYLQNYLLQPDPYL